VVFGACLPAPEGSPTVRPTDGRGSRADRGPWLPWHFRPQSTPKEEIFGRALARRPFGRLETHTQRTPPRTGFNQDVLAKLVGSCRTFASLSGNVYRRPDSRPSDLGQHGSGRSPERTSAIWLCGSLRRIPTALVSKLDYHSSTDQLSQTARRAGLRIPCAKPPFAGVALRAPRLQSRPHRGLIDNHPAGIAP
jgi:hypothetical protein